jgi:MFS family permease
MEEKRKHKLSGMNQRPETKKQETPQPSNFRPEILSLDLTNKIPQWFIAGAISVYIAGFIIINNFLNSFGISYSASEFWQIKYAQIGLLFLPFIMFIIIILSTAYLFYKGNEERKEEIKDKNTKKKLSSKIYIFILVIVLMTHMCFVVYYSFLICVNTYGKDVFITTLIAGLSIFFLWSLRKYRERTIFLKIGRLYIWILPIIVFVSYKFWMANYSLFIEMLLYRTVYVFGLLLCLCFLIIMPAFAYKIRNDLNRNPRKTANVYIITTCFIVFTIYMGVICFADSIFYYIPSKMGGGNFEHAPRSIILIKDYSKILSEISPQYRKNFSIFDGNNVKTNDAIIIEKTSAEMYIAFPADDEPNDNPKYWRKSNKNRPHVFAIKLDQVIQSEHCPPTCEEKIVFVDLLKLYLNKMKNKIPFFN